MGIARLVRRWGLPVVLGLVALGAWEAADRADYDQVDTSEVSYERSLNTPMLSGRRVPRTLRAPVSDELMSAEIDRITQPIDGQNSCVAVRHGDRMLGRTIDPIGGVIPASNQKVLTTWAALELLGPDFTFTTRVTSPAGVIGGVIDGDLYLVGDGDPFLVTGDWIGQYEQVTDRSHTRLEALADAVVAAGVTQVTGSVIGDESLYDDVRYGPWDNRLVLQKQSGPLSALTVNEGFNDWPEVYVSTTLRSVSDSPPPIHAAGVFTQLLRERGIGVGGGPQAAATPPGATDITSIQSPPMTELTTHINSYSSNIGAELLLKRIGLDVAGTGSTEAGAGVVTDLLIERGLPMNDILVTDGSGLSETNRLTCELIAALLADYGPDTDLGRSLAIGAVRGSLMERFVDAPAEGLVLGKTGTLRGVRALSGYVRSTSSDSGEDRYVTFAQILNDPDVVEDELVVSVQETLVNSLVNYPAGPSIEELSPKEPTQG